MKKAIFSVSDKFGLLEFACELADMNYEILSTSGTYRLLEGRGIPLQKIEDYTGVPELLGGKVKTLHPKVFTGILGCGENGIPPIDLVAVNLYAMDKGEIDIGGCALLRAAAKNYENVIVVCDPLDYPEVAERLKESRADLDFRKKLAAKAFRMTAAYDAAIAAAWTEELFPEKLSLAFEKAVELSYGENPSQKAAFYRQSGGEGMSCAAQLQGKALSFNNILDADAAIAIASRFEKAACAIVKHNNPCGVAVRKNCVEAFLAAYEADALCAFGGIVAFNACVDVSTAKALRSPFFEIVIAPDFSQEALEILNEKPSLRLLKANAALSSSQRRTSLKEVVGGVLLQTSPDCLSRDDFQVVTRVSPTEEQMRDLLFAAQINQEVKSNSIVIAKEGTTCGIGAGQMSRIDSAFMALYKAKERAVGAVLSSDGFFPFADSIEIAAKAKIAAIVQPGGSKRDQEVIDACDRYGIAMVFTGKRLFKH